MLNIEVGFSANCCDLKDLGICTSRNGKFVSCNGLAEGTGNAVCLGFGRPTSVHTLGFSKVLAADNNAKPSVCRVAFVG